MVPNDRKEQNQKIAGFRYSIIAELTNPNLSASEIKSMIRQKAARTYQIPYSTKTRITAKTIKNWLKTFRNHGIEGVTPRVRHDLGKSKALTQNEQDIFIAFLEKHPYLTAKTAFLECQRSGVIKNDISSSSLSRLVLANNLDKKSRIQPGENTVTLKFNFQYPHRMRPG
jgi:putative transposase